VKVRREVVLAESPTEVNGELAVGPPKTHQEQTVTLPLSHRSPTWAPITWRPTCQVIRMRLCSRPSRGSPVLLELPQVPVGPGRAHGWAAERHPAPPLRHTAAPLLLDAGGGQ
jgi:hypothetical protein